MRVPIMLSPRRLALSLSDVPRWGLVLGAVLGASVYVLFWLEPIALYVFGALALVFVAGVHVADRRYKRSRGR